MPRLRSRRSGVVVNVSDDTATLLSHWFEAIEEPKSEPKKAPAKKAQSDK